MTMPTRIYVKEYKGHKMRVISQGYAQIVQIDDHEPQHFTDTQTGAIYYCHQEIDKITKKSAIFRRFFVSIIEQLFA